MLEWGRRELTPIYVYIAIHHGSKGICYVLLRLIVDTVEVWFEFGTSLKNESCLIEHIKSDE